MSGAVLSLMGAGGAASAVTINLSNQYLYGYNFGFTASAAYRLNSSGEAQQNINGGGYTTLENWCVPGSQAVNYECYASVVSGFLTAGSAATDTWLPLSSSRLWQVTQSVIGIKEAIINVGIRRAGDSTILASADIYLTAEYA